MFAVLARMVSQLIYFCVDRFLFVHRTVRLVVVFVLIAALLPMAFPATGVLANPGGVAPALWVRADLGAFADIGGTVPATDAQGVAHWGDQGGLHVNLLNANVNNQPHWRAAAAAFNFNPFIDFDSGGNPDMLLSAANSTPFTAASDNVEVYVVVNGQNTASGKLFGVSQSEASHAGAEQGDYPSFMYWLSNRMAGYNRSAPGSITFGNRTMVPHETNLLNLTMTHTTGSVGTTSYVFNGVTDATFPSSAVDVGLYDVQIGDVAPGDDMLDADIAEVVVFNTNLETIERNQVQAYLATKYGITLGSPTTPFNYTASDGTTVFWFSSSVYQNDVAGIGLDGGSQLDQRVSQSVNAGFQPAIANGSSFNTSQGANAAFSADRSFLMWGSNAGSTSLATTLSGVAGLTHRMGRVWKTTVTGTGVAPEVTLRVPASAFSGLVNPSLLVSTSSTFASTTRARIPLISDGAGYLVATFSSFTAGEFFTFAAKTGTLSAPTAIDLVDASDTGSSNTDNLTNDSTPTLSGSGGLAGNFVTIYDGSTALGTGTVAPDGTWQVTTSAISVNGLHTLRARYSDGAGAQSAASPDLVITLDTVAPTVPVIAPTNGTSLSGTAEPNTMLTLTLPSGSTVNIPIGAGGNWSYTPSPALVDGQHVGATATDAAGNTSASANRTVDTTPPGAPVIAPSNGTHVTGTAEPNSTVTLTLPGGGTVNVPVDGSGHWSYTPNPALLDGDVVTARATDEVGNVGPVASQTIDAVPPGAPTIAPSNGTIITGTAEPNSSVTITLPGGGTVVVPVDSNGHWSYTPNPALGDGVVVTATVTDPAGNTGPSDSETIDAAAPDAPMIAPSNGTIITGTAEPYSTLTLTLPGGGTVSLLVDGNGNWSYTPNPALTDGQVVSATATDSVGNTSPSTSRTIDTTAPDAPLIAPSHGTIITGTAEPNTTVTLTLPGGSTVSVPVDNNGNWSYTPNPALTDGQVVSARVTDQAGNTGPSASRTIDATAPGAPTIAPSNGTIITGTAEPSSTVTLTLPGGGTARVQVDANGNWSYTPDPALADGSVVTATATDPAGNTGPSASRTIDAAAPPAPVVTLNNGRLIRGTAEPNSSVRLTLPNGTVVTVAVSATGAWSYTPTPALANGLIVTLRTVDAVGNTSPSVQSIVRSVWYVYLPLTRK